MAVKLSWQFLSSKLKISQRTICIRQQIIPATVPAGMLFRTLPSTDIANYEWPGNVPGEWEYSPNTCRLICPGHSVLLLDFRAISDLQRAAFSVREEIRYLSPRQFFGLL